jgi:hypothetical protein
VEGLRKREERAGKEDKEEQEELEDGGKGFFH